jgi:hypothetical protein
MAEITDGDMGNMQILVFWRFPKSRRIPGLVNIQKTIDNGHRNSEFSH